MKNNTAKVTEYDLKDEDYKSLVTVGGINVIDFNVNPVDKNFYSPIGSLGHYFGKSFVKTRTGWFMIDTHSTIHIAPVNFETIEGVANFEFSSELDLYLKGKYDEVDEFKTPHLIDVIYLCSKYLYSSQCKIELFVVKAENFMRRRFQLCFFFEEFNIFFRFKDELDTHGISAQIEYFNSNKTYNLIPSFKLARKSEDYSTLKTYLEEMTKKLNTLPFSGYVIGHTRFYFNEKEGENE